MGLGGWHLYEERGFWMSNIKYITQRSKVTYYIGTSVPPGVALKVDSKVPAPYRW